MSSDPRFSHSSSDPRFKSIPSRKRKLTVDSRFSKMFDPNSSFVESSRVDKYGRKVENKMDTNLRKFYNLEDENLEFGNDKNQDSQLSSGKNHDSVEEKIQENSKFKKEKILVHNKKIITSVDDDFEEDHQESVKENPKAVKKSKISNLKSEKLNPIKKEKLFPKQDKKHVKGKVDCVEKIVNSEANSEVDDERDQPRYDPARGIGLLPSESEDGSSDLSGW